MVQKQVDNSAIHPPIPPSPFPPVTGRKGELENGVWGAAAKPPRPKPDFFPPLPHFGGEGGRGVRGSSGSRCENQTPRLL